MAASLSLAPGKRVRNDASYSTLSKKGQGTKMDRSGANYALLIKADDRLFGQSGLKTGIQHRICVHVFSFFARATGDRHKHRPIGFVVGVLRAVGGVGVRLLEPWQVSVLPSEGRIHFGVVNRV